MIVNAVSITISEQTDSIGDNLLRIVHYTIVLTGFRFSLLLARIQRKTVFRRNPSSTTPTVAKGAFI